MINTNIKSYSKQIFKQRFNKTKILHTFHIVTVEWNVLANHFVNAKSVTVFKNSYYKHTV